MIFELKIRINPRLIVMVILALHLSLEVGIGEKRLSPLFYFLPAISNAFASSQKHIKMR